MMRRIIENLFYKLYRSIEFRREEFEKRFYLDKLYSEKNLRNKKIEISGRYTIIFSIGLHIGNNCKLGKNTLLDCRGGLIIGQNTRIGNNVKIYTVQQFALAGTTFDDEKILPGNIVIGSQVWIRDNVTILPGVRIGDGAVIEENSVISSHVPSGVLVSSHNQIEKGSLDQHTKLSKNADSLISILEKQEKFDEGDKIVFVLSTGRSGSNSIAASMDKHDNINAFHEPFYTQLKVISINYTKGLITRDEVKNQLIEMYSNVQHTTRGKVYLESDQKLIAVYDIINEIFPKAKYIWLIRDPRKFLQSAFARGWYKNDVPIFKNQSVLIQERFSSDGVRITGGLMGIDSDKWEVMSQEHQILWYWKFWNEEIEKVFNSLPEHRRLFLNLDNLNEYEDIIFSFLEIDKPGDTIFEVKNKVKSKHLKNFRPISQGDFDMEFGNYNRLYENYLKSYSKKAN